MAPVLGHKYHWARCASQRNLTSSSEAKKAVWSHAYATIGHTLVSIAASSCVSPSYAACSTAPARSSGIPRCSAAEMVPLQEPG
eukprot:4549403-Alexandrium_andersonii.AAC.1